MNEKLRREPVERNVVFLELGALGLNNVHFMGDGVDKSAKLRLAALEDVDTADKDCGVLGHEEETTQAQDSYPLL
jgi:hypothetical protein